VVTGRRRVEAGIDPAEDDVEIRFQDVGEQSANGGRKLGPGRACETQDHIPAAGEAGDCG
jgi:hypothetical protein